MQQKKFIFITGGVISSIGKGLSAASLGSLLELRGLKVGLMKCDPYLNVDPGTMSPLQHGEVYVTEDGAETDLDLGHYERFTSITVGRHNSITAGQIYERVIAKERHGDYLGGTVQVIPHVTDEIKAAIHRVAENYDVTIVEIGGTVGDIEGLPFIEAIRQIRSQLGPDNTIFVHVTYVPYVPSAGELKSKPTQHSVRGLREVGIQPDFLVCRGQEPLAESMKAKIGLFCSLEKEYIISAPDLPSIYSVPLCLHKEGLCEKVCANLNLKSKKPNLKRWENVSDTLDHLKGELVIGVMGKYSNQTESYKSIYESLMHGGIAHQEKIIFKKISAEDQNLEAVVSELDGLIVPGGFGARGVEEIMKAIQVVREKQIPFLGICYGMQLACIEFARHVCGVSQAVSREFKSTSEEHVIDYMPDQIEQSDKGGTMRLGSYPCSLKKGSLAAAAYGTMEISERHRHRYEFNNKYKELFEEKGMTISGICKDFDVVEIVELPEHPWFVGVQFHPEFKSKPGDPHPLFANFIGAAQKRRDR